MAKRKKVSAQTKTKLSQAAKKRRRAPKGSIYGGRFAAGLGSAGARHHFAEDHAPYSEDDFPNVKQGRGGKQPEFDSARWGEKLQEEVATRSRQSPRELFNMNYVESKRRLMRKGMTEGDAHREAVRYASTYTQARTGVRPDLADSELPVRVTKRDPDSDRARADRIIAGMAPKEARTGIGPKTPRQLLNELPGEYKAQLQDPTSNLRKQLAEGIVTAEGSVSGSYYGSPGERDRANKFIRALHEGATPEQALQVAKQDRRGRSGIVAGSVTRDDLLQNVKERGSRQGMRSKTESMQPKAGELTFGIKMPRVSKISEIEDRFPGLTEREYIRLQQAERETIFDEFAKNQAWAHETRQSNMQGASRLEGPDRVTFFTTSLGYPNASVPSDSLIGQYVIKRRSRMMRDEGLARGSQLRGRFPEAVRDMHVVEFTTGTSLGTRGTAGLWHKTGWRAGGRKSKGYGKAVPVGSTVLRDSTGAPIYDAEGNIRYTEGITRGYSVGTERELGFGIYIG